MKYSRLIVAVTCTFFLSICAAVAQQPGSAMAGLIHTFNLNVATNKTTNLIFPYSIKSVDRGSSDILAQKAPGTENVLQLKAARSGFDQTNLSVITADGEMYSFLVDFNKNPEVLNFSLDGNNMNGSPAIASEPVHFSDSSMNEKQLNILTSEVSSLGNNVHGLKNRSYQMKIKVTGIYVRNDRMFFKIILKNKSVIDYDIDQIRFFIRDQKRVKRTASQETEILPVYSSGRTNTIKSGSHQTCIIVLPKFTIPDRKYFTVEMTEKNGGRFLQVAVMNSDLLNGTVL